MTLKIDATFEEKLICSFKNDKNLVKFDPNNQKSQKFAISLFLLSKIFNVWPKKAQRSYLSWHWRVMQNWKKTDLWFGKWQKYGKFSPEHLKVSKFNQRRKSMSLKIYREAKCHDNEEWCKTWRGVDLSFQNWHEEFDGFWLEQLKVSKILTLMHSFYAKYIFFELKKYRGVIFHDTEEGYRIWRGIELSF